MSNNLTDTAQFVLLKISSIKMYFNIFIFEYLIKYILQNIYYKNFIKYILQN